MYGMNPCLIASFVKDLRIRENGAGAFVMEWTDPPDLRYDQLTVRLVPVGNAIRRKTVFRLKKLFSIG
jgi:hypothetical protein